MQVGLFVAKKVRLASIVELRKRCGCPKIWVCEIIYWIIFQQVDHIELGLTQCFGFIMSEIQPVFKKINLDQKDYVDMQNHQACHQNLPQPLGSIEFISVFVFS